MKHFPYFIMLILIAATSCARKENASQLTTETIADPAALEDSVMLEEPIFTITLNKELLYDKYTLQDTYPYKDTVRYFQWEKVENLLKIIENAQKRSSEWAIVQNRKNVNGVADLVPNMKRNGYNNLEDDYGTERYQSAPLYNPNDLSAPVRYAEDGSWLKIIQNIDTSDYLLVEAIYIGGEWIVPKKFVKLLPDTATFTKAVFVDRTNQNIATLERQSQGNWLIRSMNPATTGVRRPPHQYETPLGIFVIQEKKKKMLFLVDGTSDIAGYSPFASRFSNGAYTHGVPVNLPRTAIIEYSQTLGTIPRSHKCVRNASSHAEFIYNWAPTEQSLVVVIE